MSTVHRSEFTELTDFFADRFRAGVEEEPNFYANDLIAYMWKNGYRFVPVPPKVATHIWEPSEDKPGYLHLVRPKTLIEVLDEIVDVTGPYPEGCGEGLGIYPGLDPHMPWPNGMLAVFSVPGGSEGDYTHVEVFDGLTRHLLFLGKTFEGKDASWAYARRLADLLAEA